MTELQDQVVSTVREYIDIANELLHAGINPHSILVKFNIRGTNLAGEANFSKSLLRFNPVFLEHCTDEFIKRTVPHEVAHIVQRKLFGYGVRCHGKEWKKVMQVFGLEPSRCHNYVLPAEIRKKHSRRQERFSYSCNCGTGVHKVSKTKHNRINKGYGYRCCSCNERIVYEG